MALLHNDPGAPQATAGRRLAGGLSPGWRYLPTLLSITVIAVAAAPFAGWRLPGLWFGAMASIMLARIIALRSLRRGRIEADQSASADLSTWLLSAGYSIAAFYLVFFHSGPAQTLGVTLYGVVMFAILARDHDKPRRLLINLTPPIASLVAIQALAGYLMIQRGAGWQVLTLLASPFVVFQAFDVVRTNLALSRQRELRTLAELSVSEARYRLIAERSPDIIIRYDVHGNVEYLSPAARRYGWDPDDVTGKNVADVLDPSDRARNDEFLADLKAGRPVPQGEDNLWSVLSASGERLIFEGRSSPLTDDDGRVVGAIAIVRDVTARLELEAELVRKKAEAEAASVAKSNFLATVSHEIRTPLNGVLGMAQAMAKDSLSRPQRERLEIISQSGAALLAILNDVLDLSKIEAGKLQLEEHEFNLQDLASGACAAFTAAAIAKGVAFGLEIEDAAKGVYRGDSVRVRQILYNLISNALKFTEAGEIKVLVGPSPDGIGISVSDTGIGISPDQISRLFEKFVQADASMTRRFGGSGLGLAICAELCRAMGGEIGVESVLGQGSTFTARLVLERVSERPAAPAADEARTMVLPQGFRVLAAEDNPVNQLVLKTILSQFGIAPEVVGDGAAAVAAWEQADWDLILMDAQMPLMDGVAAAREIRSREAASHRPRTPIVAFTANAMSHQLAEYRLAGMDDIVAKPINVEELVSAIQRACAADRHDSARDVG